MVIFALNDFICKTRHWVVNIHEGFPKAGPRERRQIEWKFCNASYLDPLCHIYNNKDWPVIVQKKYARLKGP